VDYQDVPHWLLRTGARLDTTIFLSTDGLSPGFDYLVEVRGLDGLLDDPRAVEVLISFLTFKPSAKGVIPGVRGTTDRVALKRGEPCFARVGDRSFESREGLWLSELQKLQMSSRPMRALLEPLGPSTSSTATS